MSAVKLRRRPRGVPAITLTPLVDVLFILLVFFMVTSTYLDLDIIPMARPVETPLETAAPAEVDPAAPSAVLIRLGADGRAFLSGRWLEGTELSAAVASRLGDRPHVPVLILPSVRASTQSLVHLLGAVSASGAEQVQVVRFEESAETAQ